MWKIRKATTIDWWRFCTRCIFHKKVKESLKDPSKFEQLYNFGSKLCVHQRPMFFNHKANNSLSKLSGRLRYTFTPKKLGRQSLSPDRFFICLLSAIDTTFLWSPRCLKITEKVSFNNASEASKFTSWVDRSWLKMPKNWQRLKTWSLRFNIVTRQVTFKRGKYKNSNSTFGAIFKHCGYDGIIPNRQVQLGHPVQ